MAEESLAEEFLNYVNLLNEGKVEDNTFDGFYDWAGIPMEQRSDFASAAILKQATKILKLIEKEI